MEEIDKIKADLDIDETRLNEELRQQPSKFFHWASQRAIASTAVRQQKAYLDALAAKKSKEYREEVTTIDPKVRVTERMLDDFLDLEDEIMEAKLKLIGLQHTEDIFDAAEDALRQRHFSIVELVKHRDAERMERNQFERMKADFEEREAKKLK